MSKGSRLKAEWSRHGEEARERAALLDRFAARPPRTAAEARRDTQLRARVALAVRTSPRTVADLLNGYEGQPTLAGRIRAALAAEGVDLATIPQRSAEEIAAWRERRNPRCSQCAGLAARVRELEAELDKRPVTAPAPLALVRPQEPAGEQLDQQALETVAPRRAGEV